MTAAFVQKATATGVSATSITTPAFASATTAGNVLVGCGTSGTNLAGKTLTFSDSKANTWTTNKQGNLVQAGVNGGYAGIGSASITTAGTGHTVSFTDGSTTGLQLVASEWSGLTTTVDQTASNTALLSTTSLSVATAATTNANDVVFACFEGDTNTTAVTMSDPPTLNGSAVGVNSLIKVNAVTNVAIEAAYSIIAATGTQTVAWTYNADVTGGYCAVVVVLKQSAAATPSQPVQDEFGYMMDVISGADQAFGDDDQAVVAMTADSAPVGLKQPDAPVQDDGPLIEWWQDYEDPIVDDAQWSGPVQPQAPPGFIDDIWLEEDFTDEPFGEDSAPVGPNQPAPPVEDAWDWSPEDHTDEPPDDDAWITRNPNAPTPPACPEDAWDWSAPEDLTDDQWEDDGFNVQNPNVVVAPPNPVEDGWDWSEPQDLWDEPPDDDGSNVQNPSVIPLPANSAEDAWDWSEPDDAWDDPPDDDGSNVQNNNVTPPPPPDIGPAPVLPTSPLLPGDVGPELGTGMGPYKRPGQVFGERDDVSPRMSSRVDSIPSGTAVLAPERKNGTGSIDQGRFIEAIQTAQPSLTEGDVAQLLIALELLLHADR